MGTLCATSVMQFRYYFYPEDYAFVGEPFAMFLFVAPEVADLAYPIIFLYIRGLEDAKVQ